MSAMKTTISWPRAIRQLAWLLALMLAASVAMAQAPAPPGPNPNVPAAGTAGDGAPASPEDNVFAFKTRGDQAMARRDYDAASRFYRQYLDQAYHQDILIDAVEHLVRSYIYLGKTDAAAKVLDEVPNRLAKLVPATAPAAERKLSPQNELRYLYWQGRVFFLQDRLEEALAAFTAAARPPASRALRSQALLGAAQCRMSRQEWAEADKLLAEVREEDLDEDQQWAAVVAQIEARVMQRHFAEAEELIGQHWPTATGAYRIKIGMMHIVSLLGEDKVQEAFTFFREAFIKDADYLNAPSHYDIVRGLGKALMKKRDFESATFVFERMLPLVHTEEHKQAIILDLAEAADGAGDSAKAIRQLQLFIKLYPNDKRLTSLRYRVAQLYEKLENVQEAISWYTQVYGAAGADPKLRYQAAQRIAWLSRDKLKNYANAILYFDESATLDVPAEDRARAVFYAAETRALTEDYNNAAIHYGKVADQYPETSFAKDARFKQGESYFLSKQYGLAAEAYGRFIQTWGATDPKRQQALLQKGLTERLAGLNPAAMTTLTQYANDYNDDAVNAPRALLRASEAASAADYPNDAIQLLSRIIDGYQNSEYYPYALYKRAYLHLGMGHHDEAVQDSLNFLSNYRTSMPNLTPDVLLWLGDHSSTLQQFNNAEGYFLSVVNEFPDSSDAPVALYEAAKNAFRQRDFDKALELIDRLRTSYPEAPPRVQAQANFLNADILSYRGNFLEAAALFEKCAELVKSTRLYYAALGRLGECHYNMANALEGDEAKGHLEEALSYFTRIIKEMETSRESRDSIVEKARYRKAKVHEMLGQTDLAKVEYDAIFYSYTDNEIRRKIFDWYYFARAGFDLAWLYTESGQYDSAIVIYRRLAKSTIPVAGDAATRASMLAAAYTPAPAAPPPPSNEPGTPGN